MIELNRIYNMDCLEYMDRLIEQGVIVDAIITDPPYGTTACKWDTVIPFDEMWERLNKLIKQNGVIVLFGSEPFSSLLRVSNLKAYRYDVVWDKMKVGLFTMAKKRILPKHENICIFYNTQPTYNPQMTEKPIKDRRPPRGISKTDTNSDLGIPKRKHSIDYKEELKYPSSIISYSKEMQECNNTKRVHPTQKPVSLMEYLIKTYTNEGETVLDFTCGSGTTGVACKNTRRNFYACELEPEYVAIANKRLEQVQRSLF